MIGAVRVGVGIPARSTGAATARRSRRRAVPQYRVNRAESKVEMFGDVFYASVRVSRGDSDLPEAGGADDSGADDFPSA